MIYLSVVILGIIFGTSLSDNYLTGRSFIGRPGVGLAGAGLAVFLIFTALLYKTHLQFIIWQGAGPPASYFIPPYRDIGYFLFYTGARFWTPYLVSGIVGLLCYWVLGVLNRQYDQRFFWPEEPYFIAFSIFLNGHPGWIVYLFLVLTAALFIILGQMLLIKESRRLSLYYLWLIAGLVSIVLNIWARHLDWWRELLI